MSTDDTAESRRLDRLSALSRRIMARERAPGAQADPSDSFELCAAALAEFSPDIIYQLDADGRIIFISRAVEKLGWRPGDLIGRRLDEVVHPGDRERVEERIQERRTGDRAARNIQLRLTPCEGEARDFDLSNVSVALSARGLWDVPDSEIKRADKRFLGTIGIARDVTDRKRAEEALQKAHDELEVRVRERTAELVEANRALEADTVRRIEAERERQRLREALLESQKMDAVGKLAGGVAHDFNNRLTVIKGYCELVLVQLAPDDRRRTDLEQVLKAADSASALTRQLLLFSRRQTVEPVVLDLGKLLASTEKMLRRLIGENIKLVTRPAPGLKPVYADAGQIEQTIINLAINARDAMPGGGTIAIDAACVAAAKPAEIDAPAAAAEPCECICLSVADTGSGIAPEHIARIFEPFFTTKASGSGTGLGLSVVYGIVEQHKGWITVESELGRGSVFRVFLPALSGDSPPEAKAVAATELVRSGAGRRILYVEDDAEVREVSSRALQAGGYTVFDAVTAAQAMELFEREEGRFDAVLSDVVLPDGNGVDLVRAIAAGQPRMAVLLTSGYTDEKSRREIIRQLGLSYLQKPYDPAVLLRTLAEVLRQHKA